MKVWIMFVAHHIIHKLKTRSQDLKFWAPNLEPEVRVANNRILLEIYFLTGDLNASIERFVEHYNHHRYHKSLKNLTPADVYFGRGETILLERK